MLSLIHNDCDLALSNHVYSTVPRVVCLALLLRNTSPLSFEILNHLDLSFKISLTVYLPIVTPHSLLKLSDDISLCYWMFSFINTEITFLGSSNIHMATLSNWTSRHIEENV